MNVTTTQDPYRPHVKIKKIGYFAPPCVTAPFSAGSTSFIGKIDEHTVLKYPNNPQDIYLSTVEATIYEAMGPHPYILGYHGRRDGGIVLDLAVKWSVKEYLEAYPETPYQQRLLWCRQLMEAVVHVHSKHVLHCNINARNLLLDANLTAKLADFQGILRKPDGSEIVNGHVVETARWRLPSEDHEISETSDLFAAGSTMYEIMAGHTLFPELDDLPDDDDEEVERRFNELQFPDTTELHCGDVIQKCWRQDYMNATDCLQDLLTSE